MPKKNSEHYVNNRELLDAIIVYRNKVKQAAQEYYEKYDEYPPKSKPWEGKPLIPNYIGECFLKIAEHLSRKPNFISYTFRDEMISDGIENCLMYFRNFDPAKSNNPFAYFTQIIYYAFLRRIMKEKKQLYVKYKATQQFGLLDEGEMYEDENGNMKQFELYDNISEFIHNFEENKRKKKEGKTKGIDNFVEE